MTNIADYIDLMLGISSQPTGVDRQQDLFAPVKQSKPVDLDIAEFLGDRLVWEHSFEPKEGDLHPIPANLPEAIVQSLQRTDFQQLYSHQVKSLEAIRAGYDIALTPPTASGKTLSAYLGILERCMAEDVSCLSFYALRELATNQIQALLSLTRDLPVKVGKVTGETDKEDRQTLMASNPHILAVTPDIMHFQLAWVWNSEGWKNFLKRLRFVVIDELHTYSKQLGANMLWLVRRLLLAVEQAGGDPDKVQFICLSATCGNIREVVRRMTGRTYVGSGKAPKPGQHRLVWLKNSGAPNPLRRLIVTAPGFSSDAAKVTVHLLSQGKTGILFCDSVRLCESLSRQIAKMLKKEGVFNAEAMVRPFHGQLKQQHRRSTIEQLEAGKVRLLVATSALEAGVDLPKLDAVVLFGFPNKLMYFWQRFGRAGRKIEGLGVFIPQSSPVDVFYSNQERLLTSEVESIGFNEHYPTLVLNHLLCAAKESNFTLQQAKRFFGDDILPYVQSLKERQLLQKSRAGSYYSQVRRHNEIAFRGNQIEQTIKVVCGETEIAEMPLSTAHLQVFPGAIYHAQDEEGTPQSYRCDSLDVQSSQANLVQSSDNALHTDPKGKQGCTVTRVTAEDTIAIVFPEESELSLEEPEQEQISSTDSESSKTEELTSISRVLGVGEVYTTVEGYELYSRRLELCCVNKQCRNFHVPIALPSCHICHRDTREVEIRETILEENLQPPLTHSVKTMVLQLTLPDLLEEASAEADRIKRLLQNQNLPVGYQWLWQKPADWIAVHTMGHLLMLGVILTAKVDRGDINFMLEQTGGEWVASFYDTAHQGNGACETLYRHLNKVIAAAIEFAEAQEPYHAAYLYQPGCPDRNEGLVPELGLWLLNRFR